MVEKLPAVRVRRMAGNYQINLRYSNPLLSLRPLDLILVIAAPMAENF